MARRCRNLFCPASEPSAVNTRSIPLPDLLAIYPATSADVSSPSPGTAPVNAPVTCAPSIPEPATFGSIVLLASLVTISRG